MKRLATALTLAVFVLVGCGSSDSVSPAVGSTAQVDTQETFQNPLPAIEVDDVTSDSKIALDSLLPAERPLLIWFWAPH